MTITIPTGGIRAGRAARVQPVEADPLGGAVSAVGDAMLRAGTNLENDRLSQEMNRNQIDLTKDLNDLRLQVEQIGDPAQIETVWQAGVSEIREKYKSGTTEDGRPLVDKKNRERFGLAVDELVNRHGFQVGQASLAKRQSQRAATYIEYAATATQAAVGSDQQTRDVLIANGNRQIDEMVAAGIISPEEAARRKLDLGSDVDNAAAIGVLAQDPAALIEALDAGEYSALPGNVQARYRAQAQSALAAQEKAAASEADRAAAARQKEIGSRLSEIADIAQAGRVAVDESWLASAEVQAHPDYAKTRAALELRDAVPELSRMTPAQLDQLIATETSSKVERKFQTERLEVLREIRAGAVEGLGQDPVAYAQSVGISVPDLPAFDPADPGAFGAALGERVAFSEQMRLEGYTNERRIFTNEERESIRAAAGIGQDPQARLALAVQLTSALPPQNADAVADLIGDPVFDHVGSFVSGGGARELGLEILRGQEVIEAENLVLPGRQKRLDPIYESLGPVFADLPGGEQLQANVMAVADALYARRGRGAVQGDQVDEDLYRQALHEVMGGLGGHGSRNATGGVQEVRDAFTILPMGVSSGETEEALENIGVRHRTAADGGSAANNRGGRRSIFDPDLVSQQLTAASRNGEPPLIGGQPLDAITLRELSIQAVGDDVFIFTYRNSDDALQTVQTGSGQTFEFSLRNLISEVRK